MLKYYSPHTKIYKKSLSLLTSIFKATKLLFCISFSPAYNPIQFALKFFVPTLIPTYIPGTALGYLLGNKDLPQAYTYPSHPPRPHPQDLFSDVMSLKPEVTYTKDCLISDTAD